MKIHLNTSLEYNPLQIKEWGRGGSGEELYPEIFLGRSNLKVMDVFQRGCELLG